MKYWILILMIFWAVKPVQAEDWLKSPAKVQEETVAKAESREAQAQYELGIIYANGDGVEQNYQEAVKWLRLAAEQGSSAAQATLGGLYSVGDNVPQDYNEALKWSRLAADQGNPQAQTVLGVMYALGQGVNQDFVQALMWLNLSFEQGIEEGGHFRDFIQEKMTAEQIAKAQQLTKEWQKK